MKTITTRHLVRRLVLDMVFFWWWVYLAHNSYASHNHVWTFISALCVIAGFLTLARDVKWWKTTPDYSKMFRS